MGVVGDPLIFGLTRRTGSFDGGLLTFDLVSGFEIVEHDPLPEFNVFFPI